MTYQVELEIFAGPLDLLLHLIERAEIDIYDIPIAVITDQYLSHLKTMELLNLEIAGEFLVMAATLMQIKVKMLLPKPVTLEAGEEEDEEDPRHELVDRLIEYRRIKEAALVLKDKEVEQSRIHARPVVAIIDQQPAPLSDQLQGLTIWDLLDAFRIVFEAASETIDIPIPREEVSLQQIMADILDAITGSGGGVEFRAIFADKPRRRIITAFVALLELIRQKRVIAFQEKVFGRIMLRKADAEVSPA